MGLSYFEVLVIAVLVWIGSLLYQILGCLKMIRSDVFEMHRLVVPKEDNQAKEWVAKRWGQTK